MKNLFILVLSIYILDGKCFAQEKTSGKADTIDSVELQKFWSENILPIIKKDKARLKQSVHFPLEGDWGYVIEPDKPQNEWTEKDFFNNLDKLFDAELAQKLKAQNYKDVQVVKNSGFTELMVVVNFEQMIDDFKEESSIILRFKKIDGKWKLFAYNIAG